MQAKRLLLTSLLMTVIFLSNCELASAQPLAIHGSTTVSANLMLPRKADIEKESGVSLMVVSNGTSRGISDLISGKAKIGMLSAPLEDVVKRMAARGEKSEAAAPLQAHLVGEARVAFVVHPSNPVRSISREQLVNILKGTIKNWKEVGGADKPIIVPVEYKGGGMRTMVEESLLGGANIAAPLRETPNGPLAIKIAGQIDGALGIASRASVTDEVIEIKAGDDIVQPLILVTVGAPTPDMAKVIAAARKFGGG